MTKKTTSTKKKVSKKSLTTNQKVGIGVGLTAAAVTAAGAYFLYGSKNAPKNRRKVKSWMLTAKGEVLGALEKAEEMTEAEFNQLVETVSKTYSKVKDASKSDIAEFKKEMKEHWPKIVKEGKAVSKTVAKVVKPARAKGSHAGGKKAVPKKKTVAKKTAKKTSAKKTTKKK